MRHIIYSRVSTVDQNVEQQTDILKEKYSQAEHVFEDKFTGTSLERPKLQELLEFVIEGDTVYVYDVSRLGRCTEDVLALAKQFEDKKVSLVVFKLSETDITTSHGKMILTILASVATMEREQMLEKQAIGIKRAKEEGKYKGRQASPETSAKCQKVFDAVESKALKLPEALKAFDIGRATYYRWKSNQK